MVDQADMTGTTAAAAFRDDDGAIRSEFLDNVREAIERGDATALQALVGELHESDTGDLIEALDADLRPRFVELLGREFDFTALTEVEDAVREEILEELPPKPSPRACATSIPTTRRTSSKTCRSRSRPKSSQQMPPPERSAVERILHYPEESAGRRMQTEFIAVPPSWTVGDAIDHMRETVDLPERFFELYVVDEGRKLLGAVGLDRLLRTKRPVPVADLMDPDRRRVRATDDQEAVARMFERYNLVAAPVVDDGERLVGVLTFDDIVDVIEEEAEEDIRALGGVTRDEELADSVWKIARGRFNWLLVNLATAFLASSVLGLFEGSLEKMVALAVLAPIVASQGGNATTQTMTVAVRALATRELTDANAWRVIVRELLVGLVNGVAFAVITGVAAWAWFKVPGLGIVIGLAMMCNLVAAALGGILIPLGLQPAAGRSGGGVEPVRHHGHRRGRLLRLSGHRDALVWPEVGDDCPLPPQCPR